MVLNPDPSQLSFKKIHEKPPLKKNIVSQMISSVQVPVFTPGSLVQDLRVTQFALFSSSAKALTLTEAGTQVLLSVIQKKKYDYPQCGNNSLKKSEENFKAYCYTYFPKNNDKSPKGNIVKKSYPLNICSTHKLAPGVLAARHGWATFLI